MAVQYPIMIFSKSSVILCIVIQALFCLKEVCIQALRLLFMRKNLDMRKYTMEWVRAHITP